MDLPKRVQLHLTLPYKFEPKDDPRIQRYLETGYRITQLQRLTDREALITLEQHPAPQPAPPQPLNPPGS